MPCTTLPHTLSWRNPWLRLCLFALLVLVPFGAGEYYVRSLPNPAKSKHAFLSRYSNQVDVLVLGSSHTYYGICPQMLSPHAYSAAQVSQTLRYDAWVLHHYPFDSLRAVVLPISDFTLYEELEDGGEWYQTNRYRLYMDCDIHCRGSVYDWEVTAFPVFCKKLKSLWQPPRMRWSRWGQGLEYTAENKAADWDNGEKRAATNRYADFSTAPANERRLEQIAAFCRRRGIRLLLVSTPLRPSYRAHQSAAQLADTQSRLQHLQHKYPEIVYLDFRADKRFKAADFYDSDHLSTTGAHKLTLLLKPHLAVWPL